MLDEIVKRMSLALGEHLISTRGESLEEVVAQLLTENRATIAVAESCTGGLLAERLTSLPGSSAYFVGGVVCYSNELKTQHGGRAGGIDRGKRSRQPGSGARAGHRAFASGRARRSALGVTGIAGPGGGTPEKPVGLVHISIADERGAVETPLQLPGDRERIRQFSAQKALDLVRRYYLFPAHGRA